MSVQIAPRIALLTAVATVICLPVKADLGSTSIFQEENLLSMAKPRRLKEARLSRSIPGFSALGRRFEVERAIQGSPNLMDEAILAIVTTKTGKVLDSAWWLDPLDHGRPQYSWPDFMAVFDRVDQLLGKHPWLLEWRRAGTGRSLEVHALGKQTADEDRRAAVLPLWREAALGADPAYMVLARYPDGSWSQLSFNDQADSILVAYSTAKSPAHPLHWLDSLDIHFSPVCRNGEATARYAVIRSDGSHQVYSYQRCPS
ncbi:MAG TPA: hypothetical protein VGS57_19570 [Thermoanaerobaculia bacterium]|nr:hypothetical protein [Thermoanaerobaculia bacterium]